jgi:hypothetical protein
MAFISTNNVKQLLRILGFVILFIAGLQLTINAAFLNKQFNILTVFFNQPPVPKKINNNTNNNNKVQTSVNY